jgi:hypothetical protein
LNDLSDWEESPPRRNVRRAFLISLWSEVAGDDGEKESNNSEHLPRYNQAEAD